MPFKPTASRKTRISRKPAVPEKTYLVLNHDAESLAWGVLRGAADASCLELRIVDGDQEAVVKAETVVLVPIEGTEPTRTGKVLYQRENTIVFESIQTSGTQGRQDLRIPVNFETFLYLLEGGRVRVKAVDLSCGGMAFRCADLFTVGQQMELVIPITDPNPLVLRAEILRVKSCGQETLYAAKFIDLLDEEEFMVREAVFRVQVTHTRWKTVKNTAFPLPEDGLPGVSSISSTSSVESSRKIAKIDD